MRALFASAAERDETVESGAGEGQKQTSDRLDQQLAKMAPKRFDKRPQGHGSRLDASLERLAAHMPRAH